MLLVSLALPVTAADDDSIDGISVEAEELSIIINEFII
jgi:hypothetical protein